MLSTSTPGGGGIGVRRGVSPRRCLSGFVEARKQVGIRIAWFGQCLDDGPRGTAERHAARSSLGGGQGDGVVPDVAPRVLPDAETGIGAQSGNGGFRRRGWPRRACLSPSCFDCSPRRTTRRTGLRQVHLSVPGDDDTPGLPLDAGLHDPRLRAGPVDAQPEAGQPGRISSRSGAAGFVPPPLPLQVDEKRGVERYSVPHGLSGATSASCAASRPASAASLRTGNRSNAASMPAAVRGSGGQIALADQRPPRPRGRRSRGA